MRIQDLVGGGPASEAKSCQHSGAESHEQSELSVARVQGPLKGLEFFGFFNAQIFSHIFSLIFDMYFNIKSW